MRMSRLIAKGLQTAVIVNFGEANENTDHCPIVEVGRLSTPGEMTTNHNAMTMMNRENRLKRKSAM